MSFAQVFNTLLLPTMLLSAGLAQAADIARYNPFQRAVVPQEMNRSNAASTGAKRYRFKHPRLRAVLHAQDGSLANLEGHVLAQGESALGYTLVAVQDHSAKFKFRQHIITLQVTEDRP